MAEQPSNEKVLELARKRFERVVIAEQANREAAEEDIRFKLGDQWPEDVKKAREDPEAPRPMLTFNKIRQFTNQIVNDGRLNRPQIRVKPVDSQGDPEVARVISGLIKHIEADSDADIAYDTALEHAADGGWGYIRVRTEWEDDVSLNQCIKIERVRNRFAVFFDPSAQRPDGADGKFVFITELMPLEGFEEAYPDHDAREILEGGDEYSNWRLNDKDVRVAEYIWIEETTEQKEIAGRTRPVTTRKPMWCKMTGAEVLEGPQPLVGEYLPVIRVVGSEDDLNGEVTYAGIIRHAKDPQRQVNYWNTAMTERVALRPLANFIIAEGQEEGHEDKWRMANRVNFPYLTYKPTTIAGEMAPPPQPIPFPEVPTGALTIANQATQDLYETTGIYPASLGMPGKVRSGKAMLAEVREGDVGTFHFNDNLSRALRQLGRVLISMIPEVYDTERQTRILGDDDSEEIVRLKPNLTEGGRRVAMLKQMGPLPDPDDPNAPPIVKEGQQVTFYDLSVGKYDVRVETGPSFTTKRAEAAEAMLQFAQAVPQAAAVIMDLIAKYSDWPGAEDIAERVKMALPPEIRQQIAQNEAGEGQPDPEQRAEMAEAQLAQMGPMMQQMQQLIQQLSAELQNRNTEFALDAEKIASEERRDLIEAQGAVEVARINAGAAQAQAQGRAAAGNSTGDR